MIGRSELDGDLDPDERSCSGRRRADPAAQEWRPPDGDEFERRYDAMPDLKKAELIDGVGLHGLARLYPTARGDTMASPVSFEEHSAPHFDIIGWLAYYRFATPGIRGGDNGTFRLDPKTCLNPTSFLLILPAHGGQARIGADKYVAGCPRTGRGGRFQSASAMTSMRSSKSIDGNGAREYIVWRVEDRADRLVHRSATVDYDRLPPGEDGVLRSEVFPGLWLDPDALIRGRPGRRLPGRPAWHGASREHAEFVARLRDAARPK